jgi:hypothetical protein
VGQSLVAHDDVELAGDNHLLKALAAGKSKS